MRLFLIVFAVSFSAFSLPIKDFAPSQVGNSWKYTINFSYDHVLYPTDIEKYTRTITLLKIETMSDSKIIIFDIIDSGQRYSPQNKGTDTFPIQAHYFDSCTQRGDSIVTPIYWDVTREKEDTLVYKNPISNVGYLSYYPLFRFHALDTGVTKMTKILFKNDSVFQYYSLFGNCLAKYIQNVGLDSLYITTVTNEHYFISVKLLSYIILPSAILQTPKKSTIVPQMQQKATSAFTCDLKGRRYPIQRFSKAPSGLYINSGSNRLQVK